MAKVIKRKNRRTSKLLSGDQNCLTGKNYQMTENYRTMARQLRQYLEKRLIQGIVFNMELRRLTTDD
jgi:hypothetical protein